MAVMPEVREIPYTRSDGREKRANIIPITFSAEGYRQKELRILDALSRAVDYMTPVYAQQTDARTMDLYRALHGLERSTEDPRLRNMLEQYNTLFAVRNSPFDKDGYSHRFPGDRSQISQDHTLQEFASLLFEDARASPTRNFYPPNITNEEFDALGPEGAYINSTVVRSENGSLKVIPNEVRFRRKLRPVIAYLERVESLTDNPDLRSYVHAKIEELKTGRQEARKASDLAWLKSAGPIDFVIGSGIETYLDKFRGKRGAAQGAVFTVNSEYTSTAKALLDLLPHWEAQAPWQQRKGVDTSNLPRLNYVDVLNWSGFYNLFPAIVTAESLPNEKEIIDKHGSVNIVFTNVQEAISKVGEISYVAGEFFTEGDKAKYLPLMPKMRILMTALHELGHTTGGSLLKEDPYKYFGELYPEMEEARAELFSMWALPTLVTRGLISTEQEIAGYYAMLAAMISSLEFTPLDHSGARNMMFHYMLRNGAITESDKKYAINPERTRRVTAEMMGKIGDIKATGNREELQRFKSEYISGQEKEEVERRLEKMPLGRGLIFPRLEQRNGEFTGGLVYPATFREQNRSLDHFI